MVSSKNGGEGAVDYARLDMCTLWEHYSHIGHACTYVHSSITSDCPQLEGCVSALQGQSSPEPNMVIDVCLYTVASKDQPSGELADGGVGGNRGDTCYQPVDARQPQPTAL